MAIDTWTAYRNLARFAFRERGEWAGIPVPLEDSRLVIESKHPLASVLNQTKDGKAAQDFKIINSFYSRRLNADVCFLRNSTGDREIVPVPLGTHSAVQLRTLGACDAWEVETEIRACQKLHGIVGDSKYKKYLLCGMFLETSPRSHVTYLFRKLRPTLALRPDLDTGEMKILCALCLHPIAYYDGSWAGAMCPTDDVLAHLLLMRGDEHMFWKRANQHQPYRPEAGL